MLLVIDIGNTILALGVFEGDTLRATWRIATDVHKTADEYGVLLRNLLPWSNIPLDAVQDTIIACVVPPLLGTLIDVAVQTFGHNPLVVEAGVKTGVRILYEQPREVGADRIANAVAAGRLYGTPAVVVDFGTATSFDAVSADGDYVGGALAPGITIASEALFANASKLPRVELIPPKNAIGRNTVAALQSGILFGYVGLIDGIVTRMQRELGGTAAVIATGRVEEAIARESATIDRIDPTLTLMGLLFIYQLNRPAL